MSQNLSPITSTLGQNAIGLVLNRWKDGEFLFCRNALPRYYFKRIRIYGMLSTAQLDLLQSTCSYTSCKLPPDQYSVKSSTYRLHETALAMTFTMSFIAKANRITLDTPLWDLYLLIFHVIEAVSHLHSKLLSTRKLWMKVGNDPLKLMSYNFMSMSCFQMVLYSFST